MAAQIISKVGAPGSGRGRGQAEVPLLACALCLKGMTFQMWVFAVIAGAFKKISFLIFAQLLSLKNG